MDLGYREWERIFKLKTTNMKNTSLPATTALHTSVKNVGTELGLKEEFLWLLKMLSKPISQKIFTPQI